MPITRYVLSARLLLTVIAIAISANATLGAEKNIVLFVADDWGHDAGCYGNRAIQTPSVDQLAREATLFTHAFATTASCSASRSVIMTGLHNHANGQYGHVHNYHKFGTHPWVQSLPALLGDLGYRTARVGKFHVGPEEVYPFDRKLSGSERDPEGMADSCRGLFAEHSDKPFFLLFATGDPHRGGGFAGESPQRPDRFGNPRPRRAAGDADEAAFPPDEVVVPPFLPDTAASRAELAQYYQSVRRMDRGLGRLIANLKSAGQWDNTLLVVTSDHGVAFAGAKTTVYEPGLRVPLVVRNPYQLEGPVRSEAFVSLLDITPTLLDFAGGLGKKTDAKKWEWRSFEPPKDAKQADAADFESGKMEWLPYEFHGRSFLGVLGDAAPEGWDHVTASHTFHEIQMYYPMRVYRDRRYKLIWNIAHQLPFPFASDLWKSPTWQAQLAQGNDTPYGPRTIRQYLHRPAFELYDLQQDPLESENLAGKDDHAALLEQYQQKLRRFQRDTGDAWELKWRYE